MKDGSEAEEQIGVVVTDGDILTVVPLIPKA